MNIREKILVIEDEKSIARFISTILTANGYEAMRAASQQSSQQEMSQRSNSASGHKQRRKAESEHKATQQHQRIEQKDAQRRKCQYTAQQ